MRQFRYAEAPEQVTSPFDDIYLGLVEEWRTRRGIRRLDYPCWAGAWIIATMTILVLDGLERLAERVRP